MNDFYARLLRDALEDQQALSDAQASPDTYPTIKSRAEVGKDKVMKRLIEMRRGDVFRLQGTWISDEEAKQYWIDLDQRLQSQDSDT